MVLEMVRIQSSPGRLKSGTDNNSRTAYSNGRAGRVERSNAGRGNVNCQGCE